MKKLLWLSITTLMLVVFCGCSMEKTEVADTEVKVSQVTDDTESEIATVTSEEVENTTENETISTESITEDEQISTETTNESKVEVVEKTENTEMPETEEASTNEDDSYREPAKVPISEETYVGEYNSYWTDKPDLEIKKNSDGSYTIQIGVYEVIQLYNCIGEYTEKGLVFYSNEIEDKKISGTITLKYNNAMIATVTFNDPEWPDISNIYEYSKVSDVPNIYVPD